MNQPEANFTTLLKMATCIFLMMPVMSAFAQQHERDGIYNDQSFNIFMDELFHSIEENDTTFIFSRVNKDMFNGFGYNIGKKEFIRLWNDPYENIAEELEEAMRLGGYYDEESGRVFVPYLWMTFPDSLDAYDTMWVLACEQPDPAMSECEWPAYAKPDTTSEIVTRLPEQWVHIASWDVSDEYYEDGTPKWMGIQTEADGDTLMVQTKYLRSPIDYRFWFEKKDGKWFLMGWAAGD